MFRMASFINSSYNFIVIIKFKQGNARSQSLSSRSMYKYISEPGITIEGLLSPVHNLKT